MLDNMCANYMYAYIYIVHHRVHEGPMAEETKQRISVTGKAGSDYVQ